VSDQRAEIDAAPWFGWRCQACHVFGALTGTDEFRGEVDVPLATFDGWDRSEPSARGETVCSAIRAAIRDPGVWDGLRGFDPSLFAERSEADQVTVLRRAALRSGVPEVESPGESWPSALSAAQRVRSYTRIYAAAVARAESRWFGLAPAGASERLLADMERSRGARE
jgi:hypothetical protein